MDGNSRSRSATNVTSAGLGSNALDDRAISAPASLTFAGTGEPHTSSVLLSSHAYRMPDGLELEERGDVVGALAVGLATHDALHVLRAKTLELRDIPVATGQVERGHIHVRREPGRQLLPQPREDVDHARRNVGGRQTFGEFDRDERMRLRREDDGGVAAD